jgi:hypothetical protein
MTGFAFGLFLVTLGKIRNIPREMTVTSNSIKITLKLSTKIHPASWLL